MPHVGTYVPPELAKRFTPEAREVPDTDWHLERLYAFAETLGASLLIATHSRYVMDLNRPPDNQNLYPGQDTTGLCPVDMFDKTPVYAVGQSPDNIEINIRRDAFWLPYHQQLQAELARLKALHGSVVLWDAHSIRSVLPRFFEGKLPDLNLGTAGGESCDLSLADTLLNICKVEKTYTAVLNGRFKGGYITRAYGRPADGVHAVQLEMAQCTYMQETKPFDYRSDQAAEIQPQLQTLLQACLDFARTVTLT